MDAYLERALNGLKKSVVCAVLNRPGPESATVAKAYDTFLFLANTLMERIQHPDHEPGKDGPLDVQIGRQLEALQNFLFPHAEQSEDEIMEDIVRSGATLDFARQVIEQRRQRRSHKRVATNFRAEVIRAGDLKLAGRNVAQITQEMCDCGQRTHGDTCRKKTLRRLQAVEDLLKSAR
jgi:hypothetical protein